MHFFDKINYFLCSILGIFKKMSYGLVKKKSLSMSRTRLPHSDVRANECRGNNKGALHSISGVRFSEFPEFLRNLEEL